MAQNNRKDLASLLGNRKTLEKVAASPDAQALASLLTRGHEQADLEKMAQNAMNGDTSAIQSLVRSITENPEGAELLRRLNDSLGK